MYYRSLPLVKKAGVTTGLLNVDYEQDLVAGGSSNLGTHQDLQLSLSDRAEESFLVSSLAAAFAVGIGFGVLLCKALAKR